MSPKPIPHSLRARRLAGTGIMAMLLSVDAAPAKATTALPTPAPAPAPTPGRAAGPPDGIIPPPIIQARPTPLPSTPLPATPAPSTPAPSASPPPATSAGGTPPPPRRGGQPRPAAPSAPAPIAVEAGPQPNPSPPAVTGPESAAPDGPVGASPAPADIAPGTTARDWPEWLPLAALGAVLLALIMAILVWRRRRLARIAPAQEAPGAEPADADGPPPPSPPRPVKAAAPANPPARSPTGRRAQLDISFEPLSAVSTLVNFRLRYAVHVRNTGPVDAADVSIRIGLFAGTQASEGGVARWLAMEGQAPHHHAAAVAANGDIRIEGELAAPLDGLGAMEVGGRKLAIALVAVDCRYHNAAGAPVLDGQAARAFVVGREPAAGDAGAADAALPAKLAPFRIDQGPMSYAPLGVRDTGIAINQ